MGIDIKAIGCFGPLGTAGTKKKGKTYIKRHFDKECKEINHNKEVDQELLIF